MGVVYLAVSERSGGFRKLKVVKRLRQELADDPRALAMFQEEARLSARLHHPNIAQTNEVGFDGRHHFLEMEYLEGVSLNALQRRAEGHGGLELPLVVLVLTRALAGLAHAHTAKDLDGKSLSIVHRDVSPHNVFITYDGGVKLLDFGIAKATDSVGDTETGVLKGKVAYMAPEQAARKPVDARADLYAVGVILWQALAKRRMWDDLGDFEIYMLLREGKIPSVAEVAPDAPKELVAICTKALALDPAARWSSAAEMQAALESWLTSLPDPPDERALARRMNELFAEERARRHADIEEQTRETSAHARSDVRVPRVDDDARERTTGTGASVTAPSPHEAGKRRATLLAVSAAGVLVVAAVVFGVRATSRRPTPTIGASPACVSAAACTKQLGKAAVCRPQGCAALETEQCKIFAEPGDVENDRTIWLGAMLPQSGPLAAFGGVRCMRAIDLARRDFMQIAHGIPAQNGDPAPRPLAVVGCDDAKDAAASARHLVQDLQVPAVIGFASSQEVIDLSTSTFLPARTLVVSSQNVSPLITAVPQPPGEPRLVWRTAWSTTQMARTVSSLISEFAEPRMRSSAHLHDDEPVRLALVRHASTAGMSFTDSIVAEMRFNAKGVVENGANFREFVVADEADGGIADVVRGIVDFRPHVVVAVGQGELARPVIEPVERAWRGDNSSRPIWIFPNSIEGDDLLRFVGAQATRRQRFYGIAPIASTGANLKFTNHYNTTFGENVSLSQSSSCPYDAMYLLAYAAYAADEPVGGPGLARAMSRLLPPGKVIDVGPAGIFEVFNELHGGNNVDLNGACSRLDLAPNGDSSFDFAVLCVAQGGGQATIESGLVYEGAKRVLRGSPDCP
jgi:serine/threonine protein kinase/ABC-type branched-subunit amino acid transport system substrate-binding protein